VGGDGLAEDAVGDLKGFAGPKLFHLEGFASGFGKADAVQSQVGIPAAGGLIRQVEETDGQIAVRQLADIDGMLILLSILEGDAVGAGILGLIIVVILIDGDDFWI